MANLVWLDINSSYSHSSLALPAIEVSRCGDSYNWSKVSGTINSDIFLITKELYEAKPTILAATLWLFNHEVVLKIVSRLKSLLPDVVVVMGGPEFNGDNEEFLRKNDFVNYVFRGEGEIEFQRFIAHEDTENITGLCYIDHNGKYKDNGTAKVADFSALKAPEQSEFFCFTSPFVQLEASRGCFNSCAFCVSGGDKPIRNKPIEEIAERIQYIHSKGIKDIRILDRTFNYSPRRAKEFLELFVKYPDMNFHLEIHPALLTDELVDMLKEMPHGLLHLEAGMQSLDDKVIECCGRYGTNEKALSGLRKLCTIDRFETHADLIAGLPYYTISQIFNDVRSLAEVGAGEIQLELLKLLPGTKMRNEAELLGIKYAKMPPYEVMETPASSIFDLDRARLLSKLLDKFFNAKAWQSVTKELILAGKLEKFLDYLIKNDALEKPSSVEKRGAQLYDFCKDKMANDFIDTIYIAWIENGLSLKRKEAGNVKRCEVLPVNIEREGGVHYYTLQTNSQEIIFAYDRSKDPVKPTAKYIIK